MAELNTEKKWYLSIFGISINSLFFGGDFYTNKTVNLFKMSGHDCGLKAACLGVKREAGIRNGSFFCFVFIYIYTHMWHLDHSTLNHRRKEKPQNRMTINSSTTVYNTKVVSFFYVLNSSQYNQQCQVYYHVFWEH